jgi:hypothetical protein
MEAKVDVRKLQILNDRINQTIDALSQVRLSVHGLGHTGVPTNMINPFSTMLPGYGYPGIPTFPTLPIPPVPFGAIPPFPGPIGFSHTPYNPIVNPLFSIPTPFGTPFVNPMLPPIPPVPPVPFGAIPPFPGPIGFSHTPFNPIVNPLFSIPTPFGTPFVNPMLPSIPPPGITPNWIPTPWAGGLFHSTIDPLELKLLEMRAIDPIRIRETFPFVGY